LNRLSLKMNVFSNNIPQDFCFEKNINHIKNKDYLMWLLKMYEGSIENEKNDAKIDMLFQMRDAIAMKISDIERNERILYALKKN
jgi:hypothetical protein